MRSFEEAWKQNRHVWESTKCLAQAMYLAGHESRQTEVDELNQENLRLAQGNTSYYNQAIRQNEIIDDLQKRVDAFKDQAVMLRKAAKSHVYTEREQNILLSQADDIDKILGSEQALKGGGE